MTESEFKNKIKQIYRQANIIDVYSSYDTLLASDLTDTQRRDVTLLQTELKPLVESFIAEHNESEKRFY